jgi:hypothetical protein
MIGAVQARDARKRFREMAPVLNEQSLRRFVAMEARALGAASRAWLADREAELLPVPYFHVVYTLPSELRDIAYQNKRVVYNLLMKAAAETTLAIASDPKRLGARIGVTAVLHTWGSVHMIVPGGGLSLDGARWVSARSNFLVHVDVLARLLMHVHHAGELKFFNTHAGLAGKRTFKRFIAPLRRIQWVYRKAPFAGPEQVLRYSSRYTHRVAISNRRLVAADDDAIAFRWKDYRVDGPDRWKTMRLQPHEFIRRFLMHVLPKGFHRIPTTGSLPQPTAPGASQWPAHSSTSPRLPPIPNSSPMLLRTRCVCCPGHARAVARRMIVIETFTRGCEPKWRPTPNRIDTS